MNSDVSDDDSDSPSIDELLDLCRAGEHKTAAFLIVIGLLLRLAWN